MTHPLLSAMLLVITGLSVSAQTVTPGRYEIPGQGSIHFPIPATWKEQFRQPVQGAPATVTWSPASGAAFRILLTLGWQDDPATPPLRDVELKERVAKSFAGIQATVVERQPELQQLQGGSARGYYFSATERAPKPGEYKHLTQGLVQLGPFIVPFVIFTTDGQQPVVAAALQAIRNAVDGRIDVGYRGEPGLVAIDVSRAVAQAVIGRALRFAH